MIKTIRKLVEAHGPSGHEDRVRDLILAEIKDLVDEKPAVDAMGNLIAWKRSEREGAPRLMLSAHMDEIGLMITHVDKDGFLRFTGIGAVIAAALVGNRVRFADGTVGTIYVERRENTSSIPTFSQLYIDAGGTDGRHSITVGQAASFARDLVVRGERLIAKSMDDRVGCAIQIEVMRRLKDTPLPNDVAFVFSVQEEVGRRGAQTAAYAVAPDVGIAVDVTSAGDTPKGPLVDVALGKGPAIKIKDALMLAAPQVIALMEKAARKARVPTQREVLLRGTTDAASMQLARAGVRAGCLSIPCRYVHTTSETVDINDVEGAVRLLAALLGEAIKIED